MKQSNTPSRTILSLFALAAFGCSPLVSSQPGVPPIEMTLEQFNQGRPANFYYLADASEGYEAVCEEVLEALNEPYPGEPYAEYNEPYSKYLLRSRLSVPWVEVPDLAGGTRNPWNLRFASTDFNDDGTEETVIILISNFSSQPNHRLAFLSSGELPEKITELNEEIFQKLMNDGAFINGKDVTDKIGTVIADSVEDYDFSRGGRLQADRKFMDIIEVHGNRFLLYTSPWIFEETRDVIAIDVQEDFSVTYSCRYLSRHKIMQ